MSAAERQPAERFTGRARDYAAGRPSYAQGCIDSLYAELAHTLPSASVIADVGSGTGKLAEQLLARGSTVYCVEPNADMRAQAAERLSCYAGFVSVCGSADATTLSDSSCDAVTAAQAFHWFDPLAFRAECRRILKSQGRVFLIWNDRDESQPFNRAWHALFAQFCPQFKGFSGGLQEDDARISAFFGSRFHKETFANPLCYDEATFIHRSLSASYSLAAGDAGYGAYVAALKALFAAYAEGGRVTVANRTLVYWGAARNAGGVAPGSCTFLR